MKPRNQLLLVLLLLFSININTLFNAYVLDDVVVMTQNHYVAKGFKGIPEILTTDYVSGYAVKENLLSGARYRPLFLVSFAIEYQFFGANPFVSHLINLILLGLLVSLLYKLLKHYLFKDKGYMAFVVSLLFVAHPIHTEVTANVKSRDELLTFIFLILASILLMKFANNKKSKTLFAALFCFLLALLTKETAVTFIGIVPLLLYFFTSRKLPEALYNATPFVLVFLFYMGVRYLAVGFNSFPVDDVTNSPYLYATSSEAFATKIFILFKYLGLLIFPLHLTSDYGYNQIPYVSLKSIAFIGSFLLIISMLVFSLIGIQKKSIVAFCILYFFVTISIGTNLFFDFGAPLAERMLFQPSFAFCIALALVFIKMKPIAPKISFSILFLLLVFYSTKAISRNSDWKSNEILILKDVRTSPNCSRLNLYACEKYIEKALTEQDTSQRHLLLDTAIYYGEKSLQIHSKFAYSYQRLGAAYYNAGYYFKAADCWISAYKLEPDNMENIQWITNLSLDFNSIGNGYKEKGSVTEALKYYLKSTELNANNAAAWYNLGLAYFDQNKQEKGDNAWQKAKALDPQGSFNYKISIDNK